MSDLRLVSTRKRELKTLVEGAIGNELRLLETGVRRTERRLREFEKKYRLGTQDFVAQYESDKLEETLDFDEWIGECRMLERLKEKAETLRDIRFAN
jgi:phage shock protein A